MKLGPLTQFNKGNTTSFEKTDEDTYVGNDVDVIVIFQIMAYLEQSGFRGHGP